MRDEEDHHESDVYPSDGPLPAASLRSRTSRHTRVRKIDLKEHNMNYKEYVHGMFGKESNDYY